MSVRPTVTSGGVPLGDHPVGPRPRARVGRARHASPRRGTPGLRWIILVAIVVVTASSVSGEVWASNADGGSGGPEQLTSALLSPSPTPDTVTNGGCATTNQQTNVDTSWTDSQSATQDAAGGSLITGYTVSRAPASGGTYVTAGTTSGSPPPTSFADAPTVANSPVALVVDGTAAGSKLVYPFTESSLTVGAGTTIGTAGTEPNAIQMTPDGQTAVIAEYTSGQVQVFTWSGTAWTLAKTIVLATPTAVAISPVPNASGKYVAYVVSDPGTTVNGSVTPITLNGASSAAGTAIAIQHQANPTAAVVTPDGTEVYVANYNSGTVSAINTATSAVVTIALPGTGPNPIALATTPNSSHVYVADRKNSYLDDITVATNTVSTHVTLAAGGLNDTSLTGTGDPNVLAMLPGGLDLYVAEYGTAEVQEVSTALAATPDTVVASIATGNGSAPIDLAESPNGCQIFVADWPSNNIFSITTATNALATVMTDTCETQDPQPMQVTPDNQYLLMPENYNCGDLQILDLSTKVVTTSTAVGAHPTMVAVPPVPIWYETTATHAQWSSLPSTPVMYAAGWNPGGWQ